MNARAVPFLDLAREGRALRAELNEAFEAVVSAGAYLLGPQTERLEAELTGHIDADHVVAVGSGTHALEILLRAHGIGSGDEVITTPATFYATAKAVAVTNARPVFADIDPETYCLDPERVDALITPRTRAILAVDLYGQPAPLSELRDLADARGVLLLQDAAQSFGSSAAGRRPGHFGDGILSFYPTKNLGALGDAGAVFTSDPDVARRAASIRALGTTAERDRFAPAGISARIDELQAALLLVKLRHVDDALRARRAMAERYQRELPQELVRRDALADGHAHHLYVIRCERRDELEAALGRRGIGTLVHYRHPLHLQPAFDHDGGALPVAERWAREVLSLPLNPYLTDAEQADVIAAAHEAWATL